MPVRLTALVGIAAVAVLSGCSASPTAPHGAASRPAVPAPTSASPTAADGLNTAVVQLHQLLVDSMASSWSKATASAEFGTVDAAPTPCPTSGTASDTVEMDLTINTRLGPDVPNAAPDAKAFLEGRGWKFGGWSPDPTNGPGSVHASGTKDGFTIVVGYTRGHGDVDLMSTTPCLPGVALTEPVAIICPPPDERPTYGLRWPCAGPDTPPSTAIKSL